MTRFVVGEDRSQSTLFPERMDDYLGEDNPVRAVDVFVDDLELAKLGFGGVEPEATGRPAYHPATLLKIYVYGYLNRVQSSRRLERECQRNIELVCPKLAFPHRLGQSPQVLCRRARCEVRFAQKAVVKSWPRVDVIQAPKLKSRIRRDEFSEYGWTAGRWRQQAARRSASK